MLGRFLVGFIGLTALAQPVLAQQPAPATWKPEKPIQLIVGFQAGGGTDVTARLVAQAAEGIIPVPIVVVNKPGASGALAAEFVAGAEPDGLTLLIGGGSESTTLPIYGKSNYKLSDFKAIGRVNREHMVLVTRKGSGLDSIEALVKRAKAEPGKLTYGSSGHGGILQAGFQAFERAAGIQLSHVPYRGGAHALQSVLGGHLDMTLITPPEAKAQLEAGTVHALATTSDRASAIPDVPSLKELGYDVNVENMKGLMLPARTPDPITRYLTEAFGRVIQGEKLREIAARSGFEISYLDGDAFFAAMDRTSKAVQAAKKD
ncbi:Bug family tripartite tricarboxylate transporter substrate binding protein [Enterovirga rhinocerotis]|uniref:Tripartite-type tricarboxylate transporter receptor subunit TctC n=1 Tax=Enterovirga rhinocerotis TaxID=1339210 RepID=A0A4R7CC21_9HYPH|nr:tripartite tricarboxylate transporter substrate binding protein [Enterovirga rhinocerotis]TDR95690.1 tripartite-type tricarboxylate transporter receptor subunit TctC [Enterovirga rhinocerotis]